MSFNNIKELDAALNAKKESDKAKISSPWGTKEVLQPKKTSSEKLKSRWGDDVIGNHGFTIIPNALLYAQADLGLKSGEMNCLIHLLSFYWLINDNNPFPSMSKIGEHMNLSRRQVIRIINTLKNKEFDIDVGLKNNIKGKGLIEVHSRTGPKGKKSNEYSFNGLKKALEALEKARAKEKKD